MSAFLSPIFGAGWQLMGNQGQVLAGGKIYTYQAGSTTPQATWTDSTQTTLNANPIVLDSTGRIPQEVWLQSGQKYKFVVTDANNVQLGLSWDNISGLNDISTTASEWSASNLTPTYASATSFTVPGNQTSIFPLNRRIQVSVSAGTLYGYITASSYSVGTGLTTVTVQMDSGSLDNGLSVVNTGLLNSSNPSVPQQYLQFNASVNVASAATTAIGAAASANITVTGTTTITAFDTVPAGVVRFVKFSGALTLTHNAASLILPGAVNATTFAGDQWAFRSLGSGNWEAIGRLPVNANTVPSSTVISGNTTLDNTYSGKRVPCTGSPTVSLPASPATGWYIYLENDGTGTVTLSSGSANILQLGGPTTASTSITVPDTGTGANPQNNSMVLVFWDGANFNVCPVSTPHGAQRFTSNGTWTCPRGVNKIKVKGVTPGGGGGAGLNSATAGQGGGGGGGAGFWFESDWVAVVPGTAYSVTVAGGAASTTGVLSVGAVFTINGGAAGNNALNGTAGSAGGVPGGGNGGTGSAGIGGAGAAGNTCNYSGGAGGTNGGGSSGSGGGGGAGSLWAAGGAGGNGFAGGGSNGGGGGGGAGFAAGTSASGTTAGVGGAGLAIIEW